MLTITLIFATPTTVNDLPLKWVIVLFFTQISFRNFKFNFKLTQKLCGRNVVKINHFVVCLYMIELPLHTYHAASVTSYFELTNDSDYVNTINQYVNLTMRTCE